MKIMKKCIIILGIMFNVFISNAQIPWDFVINVAKSTDSVFFPENMAYVANRPWSVTVKSIGLTSPIMIDIGGSNIETKIKGRYFFEGLDNENLPYTFDPDSLMIVQDGDTSVQKTINSYGEIFGTLRPGFNLQTDIDTVFTLVVSFLFMDK